MSGDGPLSISDSGYLYCRGEIYKPWSPAGDAIRDQLDRARRCAEAEAEVEQLLIRNAELEVERDAALAQAQRYNELQFQASVERDTALAEAERLTAGCDHWRAHALALTEALDVSDDEVERLRAELAARPDLTELRAAVNKWDQGYVVPVAVVESARRLLAADPAPAPDTDLAEHLLAGSVVVGGRVVGKTAAMEEAQRRLTPAPDTATLPEKSWTDAPANMEAMDGSLAWATGWNAARAALDADR